MSEEAKLVTEDALKRAIKSIYEETNRKTDEKLLEKVSTISSVSEHIIVDASDPKNIKIGLSPEMEAKINYIYKAIQDGLLIKEED